MSLDTPQDADRNPNIEAPTRRAQRRAADPRASAWVSANAGAGKTKVLTDRVVRLLLAGAAPDRILCLTFTRAAAATMAVRVTERLGAWVTLDEPDLVAELTILEGRAPDASRLRRARRLLAAAVETPGGLKIETLHAFCERLLHLAPFEANVPARFGVLDEGAADDLLLDAVDAVLADALGDRHPALRDARAVVVAAAGGPPLRAALMAAARCRPVLADPEGALAGLRGALGLAPDEEPGAIEARMLSDFADLAAAANGLRTGKPRDEERAAALAGFASHPLPPERLTFLRAVFLTKEGEPRAPSTLATRAVPEALRGQLAEAAGHFLALEDRLRTAQAFARTTALFTLSAEIDRRVAAQKTRAGALDFDDLVYRARDLLEREDAGWLLYKLDRGIDHLLVDEAQDTNPAQWAILSRLTADFAAGQGARDGTVRTRFAVGDPKQSIYGFQGAAPREFEATRVRWRREAQAARLRFEDVGLTLSFRSGPAVLSAVDATFALPDHHRGLAFDDTVVGTTHASARPEAPGHVELWPVETPAPEPPFDPFAPTDAPTERGSPALLAARRVATAIEAWTTRGDESGRVWRPGEVLVLVRRRGAAFEAVIRALRAARVPVAGQDRLDVAAHVAVLDLVAAGRAALLPEDDLSLAAVLKSPLVGLDDDDLVRIAARRGEVSLAAALAAHAAAGDRAAAQGAAALDAWRALARAHGPFGFYLHLLGPGEGRARLVGQLGAEAGEVVDLFLAAAHAAETGADAPSLAAFLARYAPRGGREAGTVRRDLDAARDEVRVMTVHGAKGLEAPLVVVFDGCTLRVPEPPLLAVAPGAAPVWSTSRRDGAAVERARADHAALGREEHNRLLYVAMTRARDRLVVAPYRSTGTDTPEAAWCAMIRRGLAATGRGLEPAEAPHGPVEIWREGTPAGVEASPRPPAPPSAPEPDWLRRPLPTEPLHGDLSPAVAPEARRSGLLRALLDHLPSLAPEQRPPAARALLAARAPGLPPGLASRIVADAQALLADPRLAPLFAPGSRGSVAFGGARPSGTGTLLARADRLAVGPDAVWVATFRTGAAMDAADADALARCRQLLAAIHPDRPVRAFLVGTAGPDVHELA